MLDRVREIWRRGGLYRAFFRNIIVFCHFIRKIGIFCRLRTCLSSLFRLSTALQSLLWTSKVPKKSNMSNKSGPFLGLPRSLKVVKTAMAASLFAAPLRVVRQNLTYKHSAARYGVQAC